MFWEKKEKSPFKRGDVIKRPWDARPVVVNAIYKVEGRWYMLVGDYLWHSIANGAKYLHEIPYQEDYYKISEEKIC